MTNRTLIKKKLRVAYLNKAIKEYPHWGAAIAAMDEERRSLKATIRSAKNSGVR